jgi:hypothetical protein
MRKARVRVVLLEHCATYFDLNTGIARTLAELPEWMDESIAMLNMVEIGEEVPGIGCKVDVTSVGPTYYLTIRGELPNED